MEIEELLSMPRWVLFLYTFVIFVAGFYMIYSYTKTFVYDDITAIMLATYLAFLLSQLPFTMIAFGIGICRLYCAYKGGVFKIERFEVVCELDREITDITCIRTRKV